MDDIVETRDDLEEIEWFKKHLAIEFADRGFGEGHFGFFGEN